MDSPSSILLTLAIALGGWGATQAAFAWAKSEKRRLHQRLSGEGKGQPRPGEKSILVLQADTGGLTGKLTKRGLFQGLGRQLAVINPGVPLARFLMLCGAFAAAVFGTVYALSELPILAFAVGSFAGYVPQLRVAQKYNKRQQTFCTQLPDAMDFLARILRSGHSFSTGLQMMGTELLEPLAGEFRKTYDQHSLGSPLEDCLKDMAARIQSTDFSFFVTAVLIQRQTGGDLAGVLTNISGMIRGRIRLGQYVKAKTAEGRLTGYILVAFPVIMFFITSALNPKYGSDMLNTSAGIKLLGAAVGLQLIGLFAIRKVTTVKV